MFSVQVKMKKAYSDFNLISVKSVRLSDDNSNILRDYHEKLRSKLNSQSKEELSIFDNLISHSLLADLDDNWQENEKKNNKIKAIKDKVNKDFEAQKHFINFLSIFNETLNQKINQESDYQKATFKDAFKTSLEKCNSEIIKDKKLSLFEKKHALFVSSGIDSLSDTFSEKLSNVSQSIVKYFKENPSELKPLKNGKIANFWDWLKETVSGAWAVMVDVFLLVFTFIAVISTISGISDEDSFSNIIYGILVAGGL